MIEICNILINLWVQEGIQTGLVTEYLFEVLKMPCVCIAVFRDINNHNKGCLNKMINCYGNVLFSDLPIGNDDSALVAKNALRLCLSSEHFQDCFHALQKLSECSIFSVLIASAKKHFPSEITELSNKFKMVVDNCSSSHNVAYPMALLSHALQADLRYRPILFEKHDFAIYVVSYMTHDCDNPSFLSFMSLRAFFHLYLHAVSDFINNPTLELGYIITNLLIRVYQKLINDKNILQPNQVNRELIERLLKDIKSSFESPASHNVYYDLSREECDYIDKGSDFEAIRRLLTSSHHEISPGTIITDSYMHPSIIPLIVDDIYAAVSQSDTVNMICGQIFSHYYDFFALLYLQNKLFSFISYLFQIISPSDEQSSIGKEHFTLVWFLSLSLIRTAWGIGHPNLRNEVEAFINTQHNQQLMSFLFVLIGKGDGIQTKLPSKLNKKKGNYMASVINVFYLLAYENCDLKSITTTLKADPGNWPSLLLYAIMLPDNVREYLREIGLQKAPDYPIITKLFNQMMINCRKPVRSFVTSIETNDYDTIIQNPPSSINEISFLLIEQLNEIGIMKNCSSKRIVNIITSWLSWSRLFGTKEFIKFVIQKLIWKTSHTYVPADAKAIFQSIGYFLSFMTKEEISYINLIYDIVIESLDTINDSMVAASGLSQLCLVLFCISNGPWEEQFTRLLADCTKLLSDEANKSQPRIFFALSMVKHILHMPHLNNMINEDLFESLLRIEDTKTLIDYFIVQSSNS